MSEPFLGEIRTFPFDYAPRGWAFCDGQLMYVGQHSALFSLLGNAYGGDGRTTFALPDLRGRAPVHTGRDEFGEHWALGASGGMERVELAHRQVPAHAHDVSAAEGPAALVAPGPHDVLARADGGEAYLNSGRGPHADGAGGARPRRRQPTARQHAALPDREVQHLPRRPLPAAAVTRPPNPASVSRNMNRRARASSTLGRPVTDNS